MRTGVVLLSLCAVMALPAVASANLLLNGDLDRLYDQEIVPNFFLPKPTVWLNEGTRSIAGPYEDEMSSEPWAGPAPTPVTANGFNVTTNQPTNDPDWGVFFKPFSGGGANGLATGHLKQAVPGTAGVRYRLTGWAGAEQNAMMTDAVFALDFIGGSGGVLGSVELSLLPTLFIVNGESFQYKFYTVDGTAPNGTAFVQARASMIGAQSNPAGGGQAFVVDDFELNVVPEPSTMTALALGGLALLRRHRRNAK